MLYSCYVDRYELILEASNGFAVTDWPVIELVSIHLTGTSVSKFLQCTELLFY